MGQLRMQPSSKDKFSGQSKGFGLCEMPNNSEANEVIKNLNEKPLKGRNMRVNEARPREDRPARPPAARVDININEAGKSRVPCACLMTK